MDLDIRLLTAGDALAYWHLRHEALEREPRAFVTSAEEHGATTLADAATRLAGGPDACVLGVFADGRLRGMAGLTRERRLKVRHKASVVGVYVGPELRATGVARRLMEALLAHARALPGLERLTLGVTTTQPAARALYRGLGFVPFGIECAALKLGDEALDEEYLALVL